ncbi:MAG: phosphotransferase [Pseudomonadota bacterium]
MESLRMGALGVSAAARLAADALDPGRLPYKADHVMRPEILSRLINEGSLGVLRGPVELSAVEQQAVPSVSSNCQNLVLTVEQAEDVGLPRSLFVKVPMTSALTRWFFSIILSWRLESEFFRHVARDLPLRTPVTYATAWRGGRFYLIQENLREDPAVRLFTNLDMPAGPELVTVHRVLDTFARLHALHYGLPAADRAAILPLDYHPFLSPRLGVVSRSLNLMALAPCMRNCPGAIPSPIEGSYRRTIDNWQALLDHWFEGPLSLLHGDSHLGNVFISGESMGLLDWQAAHWGKGIRDVQYFLINALPAQTLAAHEQDLVRYYVERRAVHGQAIDGEQAWQEYRSFTFHTLMTIVVAIGFGALNGEQDALMREILTRAVAAVERVDYPGWLDAFLARR